MRREGAEGERFLLTGIHELLTMPREVPAGATPEGALGLVRDAAIAIDGDGRVAWVGPASAAPHHERVVDLGGRVVLPGLVDCHTHLVYAGDRAADFELRCGGLGYTEIARRGGGIRRTVAATRAASVEALAALARPRLARLLAQGCTTVEIKSGYGLSVDGERRQLEAIAALAAEGPQRVVGTCLAAHIVPDEHTDDRGRWLDLVTEEILPEAASRGLARFVDVFCDVGAYTLDEARRVLEAGARLGLGLKAHGEQLSHTGVAQLAAELGAASVDHVEHLDVRGVAAMAAAGTVAVLLPGASIFLGDTARPPVAALREAGVAMALATDSNPGTSPTTHLGLMVTLGCCWYGLMPHEALRAVTVEGARALDLAAGGVGTITVGGPADLAVCAIPGWRQLAYGLGDDPVESTWIAGRRAFSRG